jgi:glycine cleavage system H protein
MALSVPSDLRYQRSDEWLRLAGSSATVGITDYAQDALNDIVYVELPSVGATFAKGESFGNVESVKAVSELVMPIGGTITEVNSALEKKPETINADPYGAGWFIRFTPTDAREADALMSASEYETYCKTR